MRLFYIVLGVLLLVLAAALAVSYRICLAYLTRRKGKKDYSKAYADDPGLVEFHRQETEYFRSLEPQLLTLDAGCRLVGWYLPSPGGRLAVLVHGWRDNSELRMAYARPWIEAGYGVFIPDLRSHGDSEGKFIGMGCVDRGDILEWIKLLKRRGERQFVLSGVSMGGVTVCSLSGDKQLPSCVRAIISDCAFTSMAEQSEHLIRRDKMPAKLLTLFISAWSRVLAGYGFYTETPLEQVKRAHTPMLFIHGEEDSFVPFPMGRRLYDACASKYKEYWAVPGAAHARAFYIAREEYGARCVAFAERFMKKDKKK